MPLFAGSSQSVRITQQPLDQLNVVPGTDVTFSVTVDTQAITFVWRRNSMILNDTDRIILSGLANHTNLTVLSVDESDEGLYTVDIILLIDGPSSPVRSEAARLTVCKFI